MNMNKLMTGAFALTVATSATLPAFADGETPPPPVVSGVTMTQAFDRKVTINYTLADGPAVITLDVQTNATPNAAADDPGWTSIGGEAIWNAAGDVWKKIEGDTTHTITWRPDQSWPGHKITGNGARAVVTAWATNNTPDYMVVDLEVANSVRFYPAVEFLPKASFKQDGAAITNNPAYKKTALVMRKIEAAGIEWTMGSTSVETQRIAAREGTHKVEFADNYYIGVFEVTQTQWQKITGYNPSNFTAENAMRPVEKVSYMDIRQGQGTASTAASATAGVYPAAPYGNSFLGKLRTTTGIDFDLPSEGQWEFAARAGNYSGYWNDGSAVLNADTDANLAKLGRYERNGGKVLNGSSYAIPAQSCGVTSGTAIVGSYLPNAWGIYDMHGNVWEWCLDWYEDNINAHGGAVNIDPSAPAKTLSGASGAYRVIRGGSWNYAAGLCRPACRGNGTPPNRINNEGFRVACPVGIQ